MRAGNHGHRGRAGQRGPARGQGREGGRSLLGRPPPPLRHRPPDFGIQDQRGRGHPHAAHPGLRAVPRTAQPRMFGHGLPAGVAGTGAAPRHGAGGQGPQPRIRQRDPRRAGRGPLFGTVRRGEGGAGAGISPAHGGTLQPPRAQDQEDQRSHACGPGRGRQPYARRGRELPRQHPRQLQRPAHA